MSDVRTEAFGFTVTLQKDKHVNDSTYVHIYNIEGKPVLHCVYKVTYFQFTRSLQDMSSETLGKEPPMCWINVYIGPPDVIVHEAGKNFMGSAFHAKPDMMHIQTESISAESAHSISIVKRYYSPLRRAYGVIRQNSPQTDKFAALKIALKAVNDLVGPGGLVMTCLVFGSIHRLGLPSEPSSPSTFERAFDL